MYMYRDIILEQYAMFKKKAGRRKKPLRNRKDSRG